MATLWLGFGVPAAVCGLFAEFFRHLTKQGLSRELNHGFAFARLDDNFLFLKPDFFHLSERWARDIARDDAFG